MPLKRSLIALSLAAVVGLVGCSSGGDAADESDAKSGGEAAGALTEEQIAELPEVVAEVNGEEISRDDFVENYEVQATSQQSTGQEVDREQLQQQVAQMLVDNVLLTQAATDAGIEPSDEEIDATLEDLAAQSGMSSVDEVVDALGEQGMSEKEVRADAASQFKVTTLIEQEADISEPGDKELREQYDAMVAQQEAAGGQGGESAEMPAFEDVRDQLAQQSVAEQQNAAAQKIVEGLHEDADVKINL